MDTEDFNGIMAGLNDAIAYTKGDASRGRVVAGPDVRAIRSANNMTQTAFAKTFHFPVATVRDWEQGRRMPDSGSATLLKMIEADARGVEEIIAKVS
ncbi:helix-turn-helix domain-containing protein [uncultured Sphingomonas sp.]|uniref:helix-turn-helix domain-containing protein n=1 Tax=uncultured Sphingomonas sp. TaxID=158754 RepID=UPI002599300D|nr:helix-turn-helix domain-containing protein [uncultured Sphingomonas sp.]